MTTMKKDPRQKMNKLKEFIEYLEEQVTNHSIYVWGAQGQQGKNITEAWIRKKETSQSDAQRAVSFWRKQCAAGYGNVLRAFDCSGLGMYWLQNVKGILKSDTNANGLYRKCNRISRSDLRPGDFVFNLNSSGKATHIGYVVDAKLSVIEARGRDYGVIKRGLDAHAWNGFGRPPFWAEAEIQELTGGMEQDISKPFVFTRNLKYGCRGDDVVKLKELLTEKGYGGFIAGNRYFFGKTQRRIKSFQKSRGLAVDGIAGPITIAALGGTYIQ